MYDDTQQLGFRTDILQFKDQQPFPLQTRRRVLAVRKNIPIAAALAPLAAVVYKLAHVEISAADLVLLKNQLIVVAQPDVESRPGGVRDDMQVRHDDLAQRHLFLGRRNTSRLDDKPQRLADVVHTLTIVDVGNGKRIKP